MRLFLSMFISFLAGAPVCAAEKAGASMATPPVMLGQVALGLVFVVAIILLLAWILKKLGHGGGNQSKTMHILATLSLGTRERAALIQVGDKQILVGIAPGRVSRLHVFEEQVVVPSDNGGGPPSGSFPNDVASKFKEILSQRMGRS